MLAEASRTGGRIMDTSLFTAVIVQQINHRVMHLLLGVMRKFESASSVYLEVSWTSSVFLRAYKGSKSYILVHS